MTELSPRMEWPYPGREDDPWYDKFQDFIQASDESGFASREDRSLIFSGGGTVTWDLGTQTLSWDEAIVVSSPIAGFLLTIPAGSVVLEEGEVWYATLTRMPTVNSTIAAAKAPHIPSSDEAIALAVRIGDRIYFRTGFSLGDGESSGGLSPSPGAALTVEDEGVLVSAAATILDFRGGFTVTEPSPGEVRIEIPPPGPEGWQADIVDTYLYTLAVVPVEEVVGQGMFDGSRVGDGDAFFSAMMTPTLAGVGWGQLRLYDIGPVAGPPGPLVAIATLTASVSGGPQFKEQALSVGVPGPNQIANSARMYEVRAMMSGTPGDTLFLGGGCMEVRT